MKVVVKKIFRNFVSVRSYLVEKCIQKKEDLHICVGKLKMTVPAERVKEIFQIHRIKFQSKINKGQQYELVDFEWIPDKIIGNPQKIKENSPEQPSLC